MEYLTSAECAEKWNVSQRWVAIYCKEGRIEGAVLRGRMWLIPADAVKPEDDNTKNDTGVVVWSRAGFKVKMYRYNQIVNIKKNIRVIGNIHEE